MNTGLLDSGQSLSVQWIELSIIVNRAFWCSEHDRFEWPILHVCVPYKVSGFGFTPASDNDHDRWVITYGIHLQWSNRDICNSLVLSISQTTQSTVRYHVNVFVGHYMYRQEYK